jgi:Zn-dependent alcohol dehydrogenase
MFVPKETFTATINGQTNRYRQGTQYTVYDTGDHKELAASVESWEKAGQVVVVGNTSKLARPVRVTTGN